jgi:hypothetical protein
VKRFGLACWWAGTVLALAGVPLAVLPGLNVVPGQGLAAWLPTWLVLGADEPVAVPKMVMLVWAAALLLVGFFLRERRQASPRGRLALGLALALLGWLGLSAIVSPLPDWGITPWLEGCGALVLAVTWALTATAADRDVMKQVLTATAGLVAGYGIAQRLGWDPLSWYHPPWFDRTPSTMGNPDFTAHFDVVALPLVWQRAMSSRRSLSLSVVVLLAVDLCICEARGSVLALVVALVYWFLRSRARQAPPRWLVAVLAVIVAGTAMNVLVRRVVNPGENSGHARYYLWRVSERLIEERPGLGWGLGTFPYVMLPHRDLEPVELRHRAALAEDPHDILFSVGVSGGLPALALLLALMLVGVRQAWKEPVDTGAEASLVAYGFNLLFLFPMPGTTVVAAFAIACLWPEAKGEVSPRAWPLALTVPVLGLSLIAGGGLLRAECLGKQAWEWAENHQVERGEASFRAALSTPSVPLPWRAGLVDQRARAVAGAFAESRLTAQALQAFELFQVEMHMNPLDPYSANQAGGLAAELGRVDAAWWDKAVALDTRAVTLDPFNPNFLAARGGLYLRLKRYQEAADDLQRSVDLYPHDAGNWTALSIAREKLGDTAGALQDVRRALDEDRNYGPAIEQLHHLEARP